jgi:hypothetical protein
MDRPRGQRFLLLLPEQASYGDTLWDTVKNKDLSFSVGVADATYLLPNASYFFEIVGQKNTNTSKGIFGISSQRGYKYNHQFLPDLDDEWYVFNEEWDNVNENGSGEVLLKYSNDPNATYNLHDIISQKDSRYDNIFAQNNYTYSWNKDGIISINPGTGIVTNTIIDRNWDYWNFDWFRWNSTPGPYINN